MSESSNTFLKNLKNVAAIIAAQKPQLHFFGLVHRDDDPPDRWDLLVSSDTLAPWSFESIKYVAALLKKELRDDEMIMIARIVALPPDNEMIAHLRRGHEFPPAPFHSLPRPAEQLDRAVIIWPSAESLRRAKTA